MTAEQLIQQIRDDLRDVNAQILNHPFIQAMERGEIADEALQSFAAHQYHLLVNIIRADANMIHRHGATPFRDYFFGILQKEIEAHEKLLQFAHRLGMSVDDLDHYEVNPDAFAYACFIAWLAENGSPGEIVCGLSVNLPVWGEVCRRMSAALRKHRGFTQEETAFLDIFAPHDRTESMIRAAVEWDLSMQKPAAKISRAARLVQAYELRFWNVMATPT